MRFLHSCAHQRGKNVRLHRTLEHRGPSVLKSWRLALFQETLRVSAVALTAVFKMTSFTTT